MAGKLPIAGRGPATVYRSIIIWCGKLPLTGKLRQRDVTRENPLIAPCYRTQRGRQAPNWLTNVKAREVNVKFPNLTCMISNYLVLLLQVRARRPVFGAEYV